MIHDFAPHAAANGGTNFAHTLWVSHVGVRSRKHGLRNPHVQPYRFEHDPGLFGYIWLLYRQALADTISLQLKKRFGPESGDASIPPLLANRRMVRLSVREMSAMYVDLMHLLHEVDIRDSRK